LNTEVPEIEHGKTPNKADLISKKTRKDLLNEYFDSKKALNNMN